MKMKPIIFLTLAVVLLGGLFLLIQPQNQVTTQTTFPSVAPESKVKTFDIVVKGKKIVFGSETIKVTEGDEITIKITSDEAEEFHVHAYDKSVELEPNKQVTLTFTANLTGRFPFELEESKTDLGALEVQPK